MKTARILLVFLVLTAAAAVAQGTSGTTYSYLGVTGTLDLQGNSQFLGSWQSNSDTPGVIFTYSDGTDGAGAVFNNTLTEPAASWNWLRLDGSGNAWNAMELDPSNRLILTGTQTSSPGSIVLDPTDGQITINGAPVLTTANGISISPSGNVGIGTDDPGSPLVISTDSAASNTVEIELSNTSAGNYAANMVLANSNGIVGNLSALGSGYDFGWLFGANDIALLAGQSYPSSNLVLMTSYDGNIKFGTGGYSPGNERMRITAAGNVGIGTTSPVSPLEVATGAQSTDTLTLQQTTYGPGNYYANMVFKNTNGIIANLSALGADYLTGNIWGSNDFVMLGGQGNPSTNILFLTNSTGSIKFGTGGYAPSNERMRITPAGNIGLGTTAPQSTLDVNGNTYMRGTVIVTGSLNTATGTVVASGTNLVLIPQQGDLSMGSFTAGATPQ